MGKVHTEGPKGFRFQDLVTAWISLIIWNVPNARVLPEQDEDATIHLGGDEEDILHLQVKKSTNDVDVETLAEMVTHFGDHQSDKCLLDQIDNGSWALIVTGGATREETTRYRAKKEKIPLSKAVVSWNHVTVMRKKIANATFAGKENTTLHTARRSHLKQIEKWQPKRLQNALQRLAVWENVDEETVRRNIRDLLINRRVPFDKAGSVIDQLHSTIRKSAEDNCDAMPPLREIVEKNRTDRWRKPYHIARPEEPALLDTLNEQNIALLTGPARCGKTEMAKALLDRLSEQGYETKSYNDPLEAIRFLAETNGKQRACLLDDPLGSRGIVENDTRRLFQLKEVASATGPGRILIISQSSDELLVAHKTQNLTDCRVNGTDWNDLQKCSSLFLRDVWTELCNFTKVPTELALQVGHLLESGEIIEVGALETLAFNPDFAPEKPSRDDLFRVFRLDTSSLTSHLKEKLGESVNEILTALSIATSSSSPIRELDLAFILGNTTDFPFKTNWFGGLSTSDNVDIQPPCYTSSPVLAPSHQNIIDSLEARRLITLSLDGTEFQFAHAFYRAAAECSWHPPTRNQSRRIVELTSRALLCASPRTSKCAARNLPWIAKHIRQPDQQLLIEAALKGFRYRYPATQELCRQFLMHMHQFLDRDQNESVQNYGLAQHDLTSFEWMDGEAWMPELQSWTNMFDRMNPTFADVTNTLKELENANTLPNTEDAALAVQFLSENPNAANIDAVQKLMLYDLAIVRAKATESWLSLPRSGDDNILNQIFSDPYPAVTASALRGIAKSWRNCSAPRKQLLSKHLQAAASDPLHAKALMYVLTRFNRVEEIQNPPWDLFASIAPFTLRGGGRALSVFGGHLYSVAHVAVKKLSPKQTIMLTEAWTEALWETPDETVPSSDMMGVVPILIKGTLSKPQLRQEISEKLLGCHNTPMLMALLADYLEEWEALSDTEKTTIRDRLTGNREDRQWLQAIALTRDMVSPEVQQWICGTRIDIKTSKPNDVIEKLEHDLLERCIHIHCGENYPLPSLGTAHSGRKTWEPVCSRLLELPDHPLFWVVFDAAVARMDDEEVTHAVAHAGKPLAEEIFQRLLSHKITWTGNWLPNAWKTLLNLASPDQLDQWLSEMAEVAPAILDGLHDVPHWIVDTVIQEQFLQHLPDLVVTMLILHPIRKMGAPESISPDIAHGLVCLLKETLKKAPPTLYETYGTIGELVKRLDINDETFLAELEEARRAAISAGTEIKDKYRIHAIDILDWHAPPPSQK
jgi:hypothetical protein